MSNLVKILIKQQKTDARKSIAAQNREISKSKTCAQYIMFKVIADEKKFLEYDFSSAKKIEDVMDIIHSIRHASVNRNSHYFKCELCKKILAQVSTPLPGTNKELTKVDDDKIKIRYGNLIAILSKNVADEISKMQGKKMPSQNDITRWALKDAVLEFYKDFNEEESAIVVKNVGDDRLDLKFEADFDVIYKKWFDRLDKLQRRNDKYTLQIEEFDRAQEDLEQGMRGSNFEKQLDRYRKEFMEQLNAINGTN